MKRFYQGVGVLARPDSFRVTLDGKELLSPAKRALALPNRALAEAIAAEWAAQGDEIRPATMKLMALASTGCDRVAGNQSEIADQTARYAATDLLCYRAEGPDSLVQRQRASWQPLLDWAGDRFDAPLRVTAGIMPIEQPADSLKALRRALDPLDPFALAAIADLTVSCGSLILALALWAERLDAAGAIAAATLDESFQNERWGEDSEAMERRRRLDADIESGGRFLALLRSAA